VFRLNVLLWNHLDCIENISPNVYLEDTQTNLFTPIHQVRNKTLLNHNSGKAYKPRALKNLNGEYNDSRLNLQKYCPPLNTMSGNNNIEKEIQ